MSANLGSKAVLVSLHISAWEGTKLDKLVTQKVNKDYAWIKQLIAKEAIDKITKIRTEGRTYVYDMTLPWVKKGPSVLPSELILDFTQKIGEIKNRFDCAVRDFWNIYPSLLAEAKQRLNGMYRPEDYPTPTQLLNKYAFDIDLLPFPDVADEDQIKKVERDIIERQSVGLRDLWNRLYEVVEHFPEALLKTGPDGKAARFNDTLTENAVKLCGLLTKLNIFQSPELEQKRQEVESKLCLHKAQELRDDPKVRAKVAKDAQVLLASMSGYCGLDSKGK